MAANARVVEAGDNLRLSLEPSDTARAGGRVRQDLQGAMWRPSRVRTRPDHVSNGRPPQSWGRAGPRTVVVGAPHRGPPGPSPRPTRRAFVPTHREESHDVRRGGIVLTLSRDAASLPFISRRAGRRRGPVPFLLRLTVEGRPRGRRQKAPRRSRSPGRPDERDVDVIVMKHDGSRRGALGRWPCHGTRVSPGQRPVPTAREASRQTS